MKCLRNAMLLGALALSPAAVADTYLTLGYGLSSWSDRADDDEGLSTQVGLDFGVNDWLSIEAAYYYFGETKELDNRDTVVPNINRNYDHPGDPTDNAFPDAPIFNGQPINDGEELLEDLEYRNVMRGNSFAISAIGRLAMSDNVNLLGKLGIEKWELTSTEQSVLGNATGVGDKGFAPLLGLGISYALSGQVHTALWFDFHSFDGDKIKQDITSANFRLYFRF